MNGQKRRKYLVTSVILLMLFPVLYVFLQGPNLRISYQSELVEIVDPIQIALLDHASLDVIKQIVEKDPKSLDAIDPIFGTAMDRALMSNRVDVVEFLLDRGWDPNRALLAEGQRESDPLGFAICTGRFEIAQALLEHGADAKAAVWHGVPAREICAELKGEEREQGLKMLEQYGNVDPVAK